MKVQLNVKERIVLSFLIAEITPSPTTLQDMYQAGKVLLTLRSQDIAGVALDDSTVDYDILLEVEIDSNMRGVLSSRIVAPLSQKVLDTILDITPVLQSLDEKGVLPISSTFRRL